MIKLYTAPTPNGKKDSQVSIALEENPDLFEREHVVQWTERIGARPAVQKGENVP